MGLVKTISQSAVGRAIGDAFMQRNSAKNGYSESLLNLFQGFPTQSGVRVNETSALRISTVYACVDLIAKTIASTPIEAFEIKESVRTKIYDHALLDLVDRNPLATANRFVFWRTMISYYLLHGVAYAHLTRNARGDVAEIKLLRTEEVSPMYTHSQAPWEVTHFHVQGIGMVHFDDLFILANAHWKSPIRLFAENLGVDMAATQYGARFFGEAANPAALVSPKETVGKQYNTLVDTFKEQYGGINKSHGTVVAPIPVNYQRITIPANDSQFIETRKMTKGDICTIFNVPPFKVQAESDVKYSNAETQTTQFKVDCIQPICELIEAELTKKIIPAPNRRTISLAFNLKNLTRGDIKARAEYTQKLIASGVLKINEAREEEGYNPTEGGDRNLVQVNLLPLDRIDDYADKIIDSGQIQQSKGNG